MKFETILYEVDEGILTITLNRPERLNAFNNRMRDEVISALDAADADDNVKAIIFTGSGRAFCAGADLGQINEGLLSGERFQAATNRIAGLPIPTLCVINGNIFGGGVELAVSCDFRVAAEDIMMRVPAAAIGLCYPIDGIERLVNRLGVSLAKRILVAAEEFSAAEMKALGIVNWTSPASELTVVAMEYAQQLASGAPLAVRSMLRIIGEAESGSIDRRAADELVALCTGSKDLKEGLVAQRERRKPIFTGQ